jgi:hypothetical protein
MRAEDWYQVLYHIAVSGIGAGAIYKGVDLLSWVYSLLQKDGEPMPGRAKAALALALALVAPPVCYAILLVDSGLARFDFRSLVAVVGASFISAWALYQGRKYGKPAV